MIPFSLYSPGGNLTALTDAFEVPNIQAAAELIQQNPSIEQVGFILPSRVSGTDFHLEMMGGEFCGNAARCAALHWASQKDRSHAQFTVSGFARPVYCECRDARVSLLIPKGFLKKVEMIPEGALVDFHGIRFVMLTHAITDAVCRNLIQQYGSDTPALGVVCVERTEAGYAIDPYVWLPAVGRLTHETGCASGSIAASVLARLQGDVSGTYAILQPSKEVYSIRTSGLPEGMEIQLEGDVACIEKRLVKDAAVANIGV